MDQLAALAKELGTPGQKKLYQAAKKRGIAVSRQEVARFLATKGQKQLFRPLPESKGKAASEDVDFRWQMDTIQYTVS